LDGSVENANFIWCIIEIDNDFVTAFYAFKMVIVAIGVDL
jgi:hypothetical protein